MFHVVRLHNNVGLCPSLSLASTLLWGVSYFVLPSSTPKPDTYLWLWTCTSCNSCSLSTSRSTVAPVWKRQSNSTDPYAFTSGKGQADSGLYAMLYCEVPLPAIIPPLVQPNQWPQSLQTRSYNLKEAMPAPPTSFCLALYNLSSWHNASKWMKS
jgi:hypothetical protein